MALVIKFGDSTLAHNICHLLLVHWLNLLAVLALESTLLELVATRISMLAINIEFRVVNQWVNIGACCTIVEFLLKILYSKYSSDTENTSQYEIYVKFSVECLM